MDTNRTITETTTTTSSTSCVVPMRTSAEDTTQPMVIPSVDIAVEADDGDEAVVAPKRKGTPRGSHKVVAADGSVSYGLNKDGSIKKKPGRKPKAVPAAE